MPPSAKPVRASSIAVFSISKLRSRSMRTSRNALCAPVPKLMIYSVGARYIVPSLLHYFAAVPSRPLTLPFDENHTVVVTRPILYFVLQFQSCCGQLPHHQLRRDPVAAAIRGHSLNLVVCRSRRKIDNRQPPS